MKGFRQAALAAALVAVTAFVPARAAGAQTLSRSSRIGVSVSDIEDAAKDAKAPKAGVSVDSVTPGGPADKAGIKSGDAITEFDGEKVRSVRQFSRLVQETPSGRTVPVSLSRAGQHVAVNVTSERAEWGDDFAMRLLAVPRVARPAMPPEPPETPRPPRAPTPPTALAPFDSYRVLSTGHRLGVTLESLDDQLAQFFGVKDGVLVRSVEKDSTGQQAGLKAGDVITSVNGRQVYEVGDVTRALNRGSDSGEFTVEIVRDRKPQTVKGKF
jgi:serine protease Do